MVDTPKNSENEENQISETSNNPIEELNNSDVHEQITESFNEPKESELREYYSSKFQNLRIVSKGVSIYEYVVLYHTFGNEQLHVDFMIEDGLNCIFFDKNFFDKKFIPTTSAKKIMFLDELLKHFDSKSQSHIFGYTKLREELKNTYTHFNDKNNSITFAYCDQHDLIDEKLQLRNGRDISETSCPEWLLLAK